LLERAGGVPTRHLGTERNCPGTLRLRRLVGGQSISARGGRVVFPNEGHFAVQHQRQVDQVAKSARFQLEIQLANRQATLAGSHLAQFESAVDLAFLH
jgi:hypothetical protein